MFTISILKSLYTSELLINAQSSHLYGRVLYFKNLNEKFSATSRDCSFDGIVLSATTKSYLDASHTKPRLFITLNESF
jgi:hypothetical protein